METETTIIPREKRFEVADLTGFDAIVSRADSEENLFFAELIDFSRTGVKFSLPFFAKFDEILKIEFKFKHSDLHYAGAGRVRHIRNIETNRWQVGCSIDPPVPDEVVAYMVKTTNQERRRFERVEVEGQGSLLRQGTIEGCEASLINVSEGGLCLSVEQEHETGQRVDFVIEDQKGQEEVIAARVRWQSNVEGGYRLGCSFADSTSHNKLVDCLVEKQRATAGDRVNWLVAAVAMLAMFLPPATYFLFGTGSQETQADNVMQIADADVKSENKLLDDTETETIPAADDWFASDVNGNFDKHEPVGQLDPIGSEPVTEPKTADIDETMKSTPNSLNEDIAIKLANGNRDSQNASEFAQPWGDPPNDLAPATAPSTAPDVSDQTEVQPHAIAADLPPAAVDGATPKMKTARVDINENSSRRNQGTDSSHAPVEISGHQLSNPAVLKSLSIDRNSQPKPPQQLLASGQNNLKVIKSRSPKVPDPLRSSKGLTPLEIGFKFQEASTRRMKGTQPLQVPSEVISEPLSNH